MLQPEACGGAASFASVKVRRGFDLKNNRRRHGKGQESAAHKAAAKVLPQNGFHGWIQGLAQRLALKTI